MKQRQSYTVRITEEAQERIDKDQCPTCGTPKESWTRRTDWRCCSVECTEEFESSKIIRSWKELRLKAFERDEFTCVKCGHKPESDSELIGDHITPIALEGDEFDIDNVQTLCIPCDKDKTKIDLKLIARYRRSLKHGQKSI